MNNFELAKRYFSEACMHLDENDFLQAEEKFKKSLELIPDRASTLTNLSVTQFKLKKYLEAKASAENAILVEANNIEAYLNLGLIEKEFNNPEFALQLFTKALTLKPDYAEAWSNKGVTLHELKRYEEAMIHYDKALTLKPDYAEAWSNQGNILHELKRFNEAIAHHDKAIMLKPDYAEAWSNKGIALNEMKRFEEAITHYDKALALKPNYAEAWSNKGVTLHEIKRYEEAIACYGKALSLKSAIDWAYGDLLHTKMKICSWSGLDDSLDMISKKVMANERVSQPFLLLALSDDARLHKKSSEIYVQSNYPVNTFLGAIPKHLNHQKVRVAYFSADFHNHATGYLMAELFELHDKSQFELIGFSFGPITNDEMRQRLAKSFDQFIEVSNKSDIEIAQLSRRLNIDIAIDLKGLTQNSRTGIFAYRAAPIQVNYLGYPGTMGAEYMDYIIADKTIIPPESQAFYSEKVAYLPNSYQVNDSKRMISHRKFTRQELGLPDDGFVFCCFNNNFKILPETFEEWMRILKAVEGSVLWLFEDNVWAAENLKKEALKHGVDDARLVFAKKMPLKDHLARHFYADLFLDTLPYNAHTTSSDALWAGLPVLTLMGESFASRVAASLLNAIGLPELITNTKEQYQSLAIELARNPERLAAIKLKLSNNRLTTALFDTPLFTRNLETLYIKMVERYQADLRPEHLLTE